MNIIHFIKYNNTFNIILIILILGGGGAFASDEVRDSVIGETITAVIGIDNTAILSLDADNFDLKLTIQNITEDANSYYISYAYMTMGIKDNVWQPITIEKTLNVSKERLGIMDLGAYVSVQLGELADYELNRIKEVQFIEESKGAQTQIASITYTGLKGLIFDPEKKELSGYAPVVKEEKDNIIGEFSPPLDNDNGENNAEPENSPTTTVVQVVRETVNRDELRQIIQEMLAEETRDSTVSSDQSVLPDEPIQPTELILPVLPDEPVLPEQSDQTVSSDQSVPLDSSDSSDVSDSLIQPDSSVPLDAPVPLSQPDQVQ